MPALPPDALDAPGAGESSSAVRARVVGARARQAARYRGECVRTNAELPARLMAAHGQPNRAGRAVLSMAVTRLGLSARGYDRVRKVARTIADLAGDEALRADHIAEALPFRSL